MNEPADLPPLTGPKLTSLRLDSIEARLAAIETHLGQQAYTVPDRRVVLMRWRYGRLVQEPFVAAHIQPDTVDAAIDQLRADCVTWVAPADVGAVLAGVFGAAPCL